MLKQSQVVRLADIISEMVLVIINDRLLLYEGDLLPPNKRYVPERQNRNIRGDDARHWPQSWIASAYAACSMQRPTNHANYHDAPRVCSASYQPGSQLGDYKACCLTYCHLCGQLLQQAILRMLETTPIGAREPACRLF